MGRGRTTNSFVRIFAEREAIPILNMESIVEMIMRDERAKKEQASDTKWTFDAANASVEDWDRLMMSGIPVVKYA